ncbi:MAG TPA: RNA polymerase sigma factor [Flavobacterium sp.]|nr:RNA polymerase sigma factor [Flavobacterium sp.]
MKTDFERVYKDYWDRIFRLCMGYVNDYSLAQDMAQETFINVWNSFDRFRQESNVGTWIYRIATNICLRQLEKQKRVKQTILPVNIPEDIQINIEPSIQLLYSFIAELPEIDRLIISLELEDINQKEIAQIVGLSESNIRVKIHRIKLQFIKKFKEYEN